MLTATRLKEIMIINYRTSKEKLRVITPTICVEATNMTSKFGVPEVILPPLISPQTTDLRNLEARSKTSSQIGEMEESSSNNVASGKERKAERDS